MVVCAGEIKLKTRRNQFTNPSKGTTDCKWVTTTDPGSTRGNGHSSRHLGTAKITIEIVWSRRVVIAESTGIQARAPRRDQAPIAREAYGVGQNSTDKIQLSATLNGNQTRPIGSTFNATQLTDTSNISTGSQLGSRLNFRTAGVITGAC